MIKNKYQEFVRVRQLENVDTDHIFEILETLDVNTIELNKHERMEREKQIFAKASLQLIESTSSANTTSLFPSDVAHVGKWQKVLSRLNPKHHLKTSDHSGACDIIRVGILKKASRSGAMSLGGGKLQWRNKYVELRHGLFTYYDENHPSNEGERFHPEDGDIGDTRKFFGGLGNRGRSIPLITNACVCRAVKLRHVPEGFFAFEVSVVGGPRRIWLTFSVEECNAWIRAIQAAIIDGEQPNQPQQQIQAAGDHFTASNQNEAPPMMRKSQSLQGESSTQEKFDSLAFTPPSRQARTLGHQSQIQARGSRSESFSRQGPGVNVITDTKTTGLKIFRDESVLEASLPMKYSQEGVAGPHAAEISRYLNLQTAVATIVDELNLKALMKTLIKANTMVTVPVIFVKKRCNKETNFALAAQDGMSVVSGDASTCSTHKSGFSGSFLHRTQLSTDIPLAVQTSLPHSQVWKDLRRDSLRVNGELIKGAEQTGTEGMVGAVVRHIADQVKLVQKKQHKAKKAGEFVGNPFVLSEAQMVQSARDLLILCNRTQSGGDTYFSVDHLLGQGMHQQNSEAEQRQPLCILTPLHAEGEPLELTVEAVRVRYTPVRPWGTRNKYGESGNSDVGSINSGGNNVHSSNQPVIKIRKNSAPDIHTSSMLRSRSKSFSDLEMKQLLAEDATHIQSDHSKSKKVPSRKNRLFSYPKASQQSTDEEEKFHENTLAPTKSYLRTSKYSLHSSSCYDFSTPEHSPRPVGMLVHGKDSEGFKFSTPEGVVAQEPSKTSVKKHKQKPGKEKSNKARDGSEMKQKVLTVELLDLMSPTTHTAKPDRRRMSEESIDSVLAERATEVGNNANSPINRRMQAASAMDDTVEGPSVRSEPEGRRSEQKQRKSTLTKKSLKQASATTTALHEHGLNTSKRKNSIGSNSNSSTSTRGSRKSTVSNISTHRHLKETGTTGKPRLRSKSSEVENSTIPDTKNHTLKSERIRSKTVDEGSQTLSTPSAAEPATVVVAGKHTAVRRPQLDLWEELERDGMFSTPSHNGGKAVLARTEENKSTTVPVPTRPLSNSASSQATTAPSETSAVSVSSLSTGKTLINGQKPVEVGGHEKKTKKQQKTVDQGSAVVNKKHKYKRKEELLNDGKTVVSLPISLEAQRRDHSHPSKDDATIISDLTFDTGLSHGGRSDSSAHSTTFRHPVVYGTDDHLQRSSSFGEKSNAKSKSIFHMISSRLTPSKTPHKKTPRSRKQSNPLAEELPTVDVLEVEGEGDSEPDVEAILNCDSSRSGTVSMNSSSLKEKPTTRNSYDLRGSGEEWCIRLSFRAISKYRICTADPQGVEEDTWANAMGIFTQEFFLLTDSHQKAMYHPTLSVAHPGVGLSASQDIAGGGFSGGVGLAMSERLVTIMVEKHQPEGL